MCTSVILHFYIEYIHVSMLQYTGSGQKYQQETCIIFSYICWYFFDFWIYYYIFSQFW